MLDMNFANLTGDVKELKEAIVHLGQNIENAAKYSGSFVIAAAKFVIHGSVGPPGNGRSALTMNEC